MIHNLLLIAQVLVLHVPSARSTGTRSYKTKSLSHKHIFSFHWILKGLLIRNESKELVGMVYMYLQYIH
jgi:hypothetical protein